MQRIADDRTLGLIARPPVWRFRVARNWWLGLAVLAGVGTFTVAPAVFVLVESFNVADLTQPFRFGLDGWAAVFSSPKTLDSIGYSFLLSIRIPLGVAVAFVIAWLLIRVRIPGRSFIEHALWFGFFLPILPIAMGWTLLLDAHYGLINELTKRLPFIHASLFSIYSVSGIIWVHLTLTTVPVMVILLAPALRQLDAATEEAADICGANIVSTLWRITIPLIAPAILTTLVAGLIRSLDVFELEQYLGVPAGIYVYSTRIYDLVSADPPLYPQAMALSALFLVILLLIAFFYQYWVGRFGVRTTLSGKGNPFRARRGSRWATAASVCVILYLCISIGLPLVVLVLGSLNRLFGFFFTAHPWTFANWREVLTSPDVGQATLNSLTIGLEAGLIGTLAYAVLAWILVSTRIRARAAISLMVWLPWAVPGVVLGVTFSSMILSTPVLSKLYGTSIPLVLAMIIKSMPIGVQMLRTSIAQISTDLEEAARISGARFATVFRCVTLPLIAPMCVAVFLLVFIATLTDISTFVLLASPGSRTLSLVMFGYATASKPEAAAVIGVIIAVLSLTITSIAFRFGIRTREMR